MTFVDKKIKFTIDHIRNGIDVEVYHPDVYFIPCEYKTTNTPPAPDAGWEKFNGTITDTGIDKHFWFKLDIDVPGPKDEVEYRLRAKTGREGQWDAQNPQCTVFIDGETAYQAFDTNHVETPVSSGKHTVYIYFYTGMNGISSVNMSIALYGIDLVTEALYYDMNVPYEAMLELSPDSREYHLISNYLDKACQFIDYRKQRLGGFRDSVKEALKYMREEFYEKECLNNCRNELALIGHTHIDVAWLWTLAQTAEKAQRSFSTVIRLMEKYPEYVFMSSQPQLYAYVKENDPELYEKIKEKIKEGRWEAEGSMWLEADTNLVSGESLVRQILLGKKFMKEEFGVENKSLWLPDVFGYSAALPQILKKSNVPQFFTAKISWCETNKFPHDNFIWQGIDGSEVFAVLSETYVKKLNPKVMLSSWSKHVSKKYSDLQVCTFGFGDGGGGPTAEMLENYRRLEKGIPGMPKVTMRPSAETLDRIQAKFEETTKQVKFTPKWKGELYLEMHRGTYTSIAKNKKNNRKCEYLYQDAETLSVTEGIFNKDAKYPVKMLDENWHTILKNQFHDIIPGSSIKQVYDVCDVEYAKLYEDGNAVKSSVLGYLASNVNADGGVLVYNPTPFAQSGIVEVDGKKYKAENVPAHGWKVVTESEFCGCAKATEKVIENCALRVEFNDKYHIVSIYDKKNERELIPEGEEANVFEIYEDYPREYDAWEITEYYKQKMWLCDGVDSVEVINEEDRAGLKICRTYMDSKFEQVITLKEGSDRVDFDTKVDWHEDHVLLKAAFPLDVIADNATYEIQFGHIQRPTHRNTSWDEAKFEVSAHKWADLSDSSYGVSLLNDCKYGYSCEYNVMKLSLLKAATYPNPEADRGINEFTYSIYPHAGTVTEGGTIKEGYKLNKPLEAVAVTGKGAIPAEYSLVSSSTESFAVDTVKKGEYCDDIIVRGYECRGGKASVTLDFGFDVKKAYMCDLMENELSELEVKDNTVSFKAGNFEIVTIKVVK